MIYNVLAGVVALVEADDAEAAIAKLHAVLRAADFEVYEGGVLDGQVPEVFESEPLQGVEPIR